MFALLASIALSLCVSSPAAAKSKGKGPVERILKLSFAASGSYSAHGSVPKPEYFVSGTNSVSFSWKSTWENVVLLLSEGSRPIPGLSMINEGLEKTGEQVTSEELHGSWNASGTNLVPATEGQTEPFNCSGGVTESVGSTPYLFVKQLGGGSFTFKMTGAAAPELSNWNNCIFPEGGSLMGHYYWGDAATATGPFSGEVTLNKKELSERVVTKAISPAQSQLPGSNCAPAGSESKWVGAEECSSSFSWSGTVKIEAPCESVETGHGYNLLSADMKAALHRLYAHLRSEEACFRFTVGSRTFSEQEDLYNRWHQIADGSKSEPKAELEKELKEAGFAQFPKGWTSSGTAEGGPAKPGTSRHESGNAADITVLWPPEQKEDVSRYQAAAKAAGLCGPPASDRVHVELPYKKGKEKTATCHFG